MFWCDFISYNSDQLIIEAPYGLQWNTLKKHLSKKKKKGPKRVPEIP